MATPVVFIHGLWLHSESWDPWVEVFREAGFEPHAPGWPGDGATAVDTRANPKAVAGYGIQDVVDSYVKFIDGLETKPIVIGHSFGGLITQRLLGEDHAIAGVAIDPAPAKGVLILPPSALRVASIALRNPLNRNGSVSLSQGQFRYGFGNAVSVQESNELYERCAIPTPGKPLFEASIANFVPNSPAKVATDNAKRGPLLITAGEHDHTVPATISKQTKKLYSKSGAVTDLIEFEHRGHSLTIDSGWREVADRVLGWIQSQSL